jgi:hypothetical protein
MAIEQRALLQQHFMSLKRAIRALRRTHARRLRLLKTQNPIAAVIKAAATSTRNDDHTNPSTNAVVTSYQRQGISGRTSESQLML